MAIPQQAELSMQLDLSISCSQLISLDYLSKSDPMVIVHIRDMLSKKWVEVGRTEKIQDDCFPKFAVPVTIKYLFEEVQNLRFTVIDVDKMSGNNVTKFDLIGKMKCSLGDIVGSAHSSYTHILENKKHPTRQNGSITVKAMELAKGLEGWEVKLNLRGRGLDKKDFFGKSDPYLVFERPDNTGGYTPVLKTEVIKNTLDPVWLPVSCPIGRLAPSSVESEIRIMCYDWDAYGSHDFIGFASTSISQLRSKPKHVFPLINPKKKEKKGSKYTHSGTLEIDYLEHKIHTFLDYILGGMEISLSIAIDFTGSNGNPLNPSSLHYHDPNQLNEYGKAIRSVGDVCAPYDRSGMFSAYGFGAQLNATKETSHHFNLNFTPDPLCRGIDGVLLAYRDSFFNLTLSGPTYFSEVLHSANAIASSYPTGTKYQILLIITDGVINDSAKTIEALRATSTLPVSVIIVGVGSADFAAMEQLDDDDGALGFPRDCVQFVPFREFKNGPIEVLAKKTLAEVPEQLVKWAQMSKIVPLPH
eukprot:TRINITY_DN2673_c0_g1_i3.p1 TRINITY_DN2673_c0_g1~~TRINITY_DN2673_c0_g1_i3.p1  ORF type:complete len:528 (-),score=182.53 TRINITY_DN2673_c0_g1_i3:41-1624(-)